MGRDDPGAPRPSPHRGEGGWPEARRMRGRLETGERSKPSSFSLLEKERFLESKEKGAFGGVRSRCQRRRRLPSLRPRCGPALAMAFVGGTGRGRGPTSPPPGRVLIEGWFGAPGSSRPTKSGGTISAQLPPSFTLHCYLFLCLWGAASPARLIKPSPFQGEGGGVSRRMRVG